MTEDHDWYAKYRREVEAARETQKPIVKRAGCRIRTEAEALRAITDNADFIGSEGPYTILKVGADGRLLDYLEKWTEQNP